MLHVHGKPLGTAGGETGKQSGNAKLCDQGVIIPLWEKPSNDEESFQLPALPIQMQSFAGKVFWPQRGALPFWVVLDLKLE